MEQNDNEFCTRQRGRQSAPDRASLWPMGLAIVATLCVMFVLLRWLSASGTASGNSEDAPDLSLAAAQAPITEKNFPAGLGGGRIQLIDTRFSAGLGSGKIQLIQQTGPYLGLSLSAIPPDVAARLGLAAGAGVYVNSLVFGSPGEKAGILAGDLLLKLDTVALAAPADVGRALSGKNAGQTLKVVYSRGGVKHSTHLTLANPPLGLDIGLTQDKVWLGADVQDIDAIMRIQFNLLDTQGVIVNFVAPDSPAAAAGLADGDVIRRVAQTRIRDVAQFQSLVAKLKPGERLRLGITRSGAPRELDVVLGFRPIPKQSVAYLPPANITVEATWIGMDLDELAPGGGAALGLPAEVTGIRVVDVGGGPAGMAGFQNGDVILAINGAPTPDLQGFIKATQRQNSAAVEVYRAGRRLFISTPPPGFTVQGARLKTAQDNKFRQVAFSSLAVVAALVADKDINARISGEAKAQAVILVDLGRKSYSIVELRSRTPLADILQQNGAAALLCADLSPATASALGAKGIGVYSGVVGTVLEGLALYQQQGLAPSALQ